MANLARTLRVLAIATIATVGIAASGSAYAATSTTTPAPATIAVASTDAATTDEAAAPTLNGVWKGYFYNRRNNAFSVTLNLTVTDGTITGDAYIPDSSISTKPRLTGSVDADGLATIQASSGFTYKLTMSADGSKLTGPVSGANSGRLELSRQSRQE